MEITEENQYLLNINIWSDEYVDVEDVDGIAVLPQVRAHQPPIHLVAGRDRARLRAGGRGLEIGLGDRPGDRRPGGVSATGPPVGTRGGQGSAMGIYIDPATGMVWGASDSRAFDGGAKGR